MAKQAPKLSTAHLDGFINVSFFPTTQHKTSVVENWHIWEFMTNPPKFYPPTVFNLYNWFTVQSSQSVNVFLSNAFGQTKVFTIKVLLYGDLLKYYNH